MALGQAEKLRVELRPMGPTGPSPTTVSAAWMSMPGVKPSAGLPFLSTP
jgi:hypothetical protein